MSRLSLFSIDFFARVCYNDSIMNKKMSNYILKVVENNGPLKILQVAYGVVGLISLVIAGLISLVNQPLGWGFLIIPLVCFVALGMNTVAWALIRLLIDTLAVQKMREMDARLAAEKVAKAKRTASARKTSAKKASAKK